MEKQKLQNTIEEIGRYIEIPSEKKEKIIEQFSSLDEKKVIIELSVYAHRLFNHDSIEYNQVLDIIRSINPEIAPSVNAMKEALNNMFSNVNEGNMSLEDNHKLVNESLVECTRLLNQYGVDYYIVGALPCFIKVGIPLFRYHDDIDIMVNEDDLLKVAEIMEIIGYEFHDDRFPSKERFHEMEENHPPHTVLAQNPHNEFHLGFFTFRREQDKSITMREYSHRLENDEVVIDVLERQSDPIGTQLRYDETPTEYLGTSFKTGTVESVYNLKEYTRRPKDITDVNKLKPFIDFEKLEELKKHPNHNVTKKT